MKVTISRRRATHKKTPKKELFAFGDMIGAELIINERDKEFDSNGTMRYYAHFKYCEVKDGNMLIGVSGDGRTINAAIRDYAKQISGKHLVFDAYTQDRKDLKAPVLSYKSRKRF